MTHWVTWRELAEHGAMGCRLRPCEAMAECLLDEEPYCLDCADLIVERLNAIGDRPDLRKYLPALSDR